ncbi:(2,3-dihydroxybenzoyl)adenylate synthase [Plantactinospora siamensis]|uniref:(2,3-dihydroxybenzoyl)adenylate synthase n=1 Tax=Plantactinospora siamensis TaxID=555372 RepID=A0ABV6P4L2_9ACTN
MTPPVRIVVTIPDGRCDELDGVVPFPPDFAARYRAAGYWRGRVLGDLLRPSPGGDSVAVVAGGDSVAVVAGGDSVAVVAGGDSVAVVDPAGRRWAYAELDDLADRFAAGLADLGVARGDRVVVQLPNIAEFAVVSIGCYRLGAIPVYGLPGHRQREIGYLIRHSDAVAYVVADQHQGFRYPELARQVRREAPALRHVVVVGDPDGFTGYADLLLAEPRELPGPDPSDVAFFLLSGGTTGLPKLIPRTHDDYAYQLTATARACGMDEHGCYLASLPVAHNAALGCPGLLGTLAVGGKVLLPPNPSPDEVFELIGSERVTLTTLMPPMVQMWRDALEFFDVDLSGLLIQVGSAHLSPELARGIYTEMGSRLTHWFGMAEGILTYTRLDDPIDVIVHTQGRPLAEADEIRVVDPEGADVPPGEVGELLTRGPYTIRGYYRAPEVNATAFTADGFLRTGDLVRFTPDGNMVVEGRLKDVINKGGEKITAAELEDVLHLHPALRRVAVVGVPDPVMGEVPCVFAVCAEPVPTLRDVREYLREAGVAGYKLPDHFEVVDSLPRTTVGKIDKNRLRQSLSAPSSGLPNPGRG